MNTVDEETMRQQGQFLATISHEIRTPLNAISGMSQLLADTPLSKDQNEFVDTILQAGSHLLSMVDNLLDVAKLQADELVLAEDVLDVTDELKAAICEMTGFAKEKGLSISIQCTPDVGGHKVMDRRRFRQCLSNLLSNAVKFTAKGKIRISSWMGASEAGADMLYVSITDSGPGIPTESMDRIFELFHQQDTGIGRSFDGAGLGLPVTRRLARLMGGDVEVASTPGVGSTFTLALTVQEPEPQSADTEQSAGHILIVEDNRTNQRLIGLVLEKLGHSSAVASDGKEGLELFQAEHFDLILMDLHMPVMDGFEATTQIRKSGLANADLPIVALTADVRPGIEERISAAGMDAYLAKPFEVPVLAATISAALAENEQVRVAPETSRGVRTQSG